MNSGVSNDLPGGQSKTFWMLLYVNKSIIISSNPYISILCYKLDGNKKISKRLVQSLKILIHFNKKNISVNNKINEKQPWYPIISKW